MGYRLGRLLAAKLVGRVRPYVDCGSAPHHWFLTAAGVSALTGARPGRGWSTRPNPLFVAHTVAIADVWLALRDVGPGAGVRLDRWQRDAEGWVRWQAGGRDVSLTPDAVAAVRLEDDRSARLLIEVDLGTMTQARLRLKVARYLEWLDRESEEHTALLLLTTSEARAANFIGRARALCRKASRAWPTVAASSLVRSADAAFADRVWRTTTGSTPVRVADLVAGMLDGAAARRRAREEDEAVEREAWILSAPRRLSDERSVRRAFGDELGEIILGACGRLSDQLARYAFARENADLLYALAQHAEAWRRAEWTREPGPPVPAALAERIRGELGHADRTG